MSFAAVVPVITAISAVAGLAGAVISARAQKQEANAQAQMMEANARAARRDANNRMAEAQARGRERLKEAELLGSRAQTVAAGSGAGLIGSATTMMAELAGKGKQNERLELYAGETQQQQLNTSADREEFAARSKRASGKAAMKAGILSGVSNFASSMASANFGGGATTSGWQASTLRYG